MRKVVAVLAIVACTAGALLLTAGFDSQQSSVVGYWRVGPDDEIKVAKPLLIRIERSGDGYTIANLNLGGEVYSTAETFGDQLLSFPDSGQEAIRLEYYANIDTLTFIIGGGDPTAPPRDRISFVRPQQSEEQLAAELAEQISAQQTPAP